MLEGRFESKLDKETLRVQWYRATAKIEFLSCVDSRTVRLIATYPYRLISRQLEATIDHPLLLLTLARWNKYKNKRAKEHSIGSRIFVQNSSRVCKGRDSPFDSKRTVCVVKRGISFNTPRALTTPQQSPDQNPIELLRSELGGRISNTSYQVWARSGESTSRRMAQNRWKNHESIGTSDAWLPKSCYEKDQVECHDWFVAQNREFTNTFFALKTEPLHAFRFLPLLQLL